MQRNAYTTKDLRQLLIESIEGIKAGRITPDRGAAVAKLAHQINESFKVEIGIAQAVKEFGMKPETIGAVVVADTPDQNAIAHEPEPAAIAAPKESAANSDGDEEMLHAILRQSERALTPSEIHDLMPAIGGAAGLTVPQIRMKLEQMVSKMRVSRLGALGDRTKYRVAA